MQMKKATIAVLILAVMILASAQPAFSRGCEVPATGDPLIVVDKSAKGTKLSGPLTIYYELYDPDSPSTSLCTLHIFTRLTKGHNHYPFSDKVIDVEYNSIPAIQNAITVFFGSVITALFGSNIQGYALKSVDKVVEPDTEGIPGFNDGFYTILDVVVAVEK